MLRENIAPEDEISEAPQRGSDEKHAKESLPTTKRAGAEGHYQQRYIDYGGY